MHAPVALCNALHDGYVAFQLSIGLLVLLIYLPWNGKLTTCSQAVPLVSGRVFPSGIRGVRAVLNNNELIESLKIAAAPTHKVVVTDLSKLLLAEQMRSVQGVHAVGLLSEGC